jgi:hypothetical protein
MISTDHNVISETALEFIEPRTIEVVFPIFNRLFKDTTISPQNLALACGIADSMDMLHKGSDTLNVMETVSPAYHVVHSLIPQDGPSTIVMVMHLPDSIGPHPMFDGRPACEASQKGQTIGEARPCGQKKSFGHWFG